VPVKQSVTKQSKGDDWVLWNSHTAPHLPINTIVELRFSHSRDTDIGKITEPWIWDNVEAYRVL